MLCGVLGVLQYGWIGEVSAAARDRLRGSLQASLNRISLDFGTEIATAARALMPVDAASDIATVETEMAARYAQWKTTARHRQMFRHIAIAEPRNKVLVLRSLNLDKDVFEIVGVARGLGAREGAPGNHDVGGGAARPRLSGASPRTLRECFSTCRPFRLPGRAALPVSPAAARFPR